MRVLLTIPDEMVAEVDRARGDVPRAAWIRRAIEARLQAHIVGSPVPVKPLDKEAE